MSLNIEILFPEVNYLFGDGSNVRYLKNCLPDADFIEDHFNEEPFFVRNSPSLIYCGGMTEQYQEQIISQLMPWRDLLKERIREGVPMLFTSNAIELLARFIQNEDGSRVPGLDLYPFGAKRDRMNRFNCLFKGKFQDMDIIGFKTQFTFAYGKTDYRPFMQVDRGTGMNPKAAGEGIHDHNLFATYLVGPFLIMNPHFTKYFLQDVMGLDDVSLPWEDALLDAYNERLAEFSDPETKY